MLIRSAEQFLLASLQHLFRSEAGQSSCLGPVIQKCKSACLGIIQQKIGREQKR